MKTSLTVSMECLYSCHLFSVGHLGHLIAHMDISNIFFRAEARNNIIEGCQIQQRGFCSSVLYLSALRRVKHKNL